MKTQSKRFAKIATAVTAMALCASFVAPGLVTASAATIHHFYGEDWTWGTTATNATEAVANAVEVADQIAAEGQVLLKNNNNALPMKGNEWVTILSTSSTEMLSSVAGGIEAGGFKVHQTTSKTVAGYTPADVRAHANSDVAIVMMSGSMESGNGEGEGQSSASLTELEDNTYGSEKATLPSGEAFEHANSPTKTENGETKEYKHNLQMLNADEQVLEYAKANFKKVIVLLTNDIPTEIGALQYDDGIDAILLSGHFGKYGYEQIGYVLNGSVNPSGRTVDLWAWDITGRTSWFNDGNTNNIYRTATQTDNAVIGNMGFQSAFRISGTDSEYYERSVARAAQLNGEGAAAEAYPYYLRQQHATGDIAEFVYNVQYEEDIYQGYRYYETGAAEVLKGTHTGVNAEIYPATAEGAEKWYNDQVIYSFGYGLSYTDFEWEIVDTDLEAWNEVKKGGNIEKATGKMTITVKVTNVGSVAGMDVVEIYGHAPYYKNGIEKAEHELVGFEKTGTIQPGKSQLVKVEVNVQDLAAYDYLDANGNGNTGYELDAIGETDAAGNKLHDTTGKYELRVMKNSHEYGNGAGMTIVLDDVNDEANLKVDDFSGNTVGNLFSGDDINNTLGYDPATGKTLVEEGKMTLLSRADFAATWPQASGTTVGPNGEAKGWDLVRSDEFFNLITTFADYNGEHWQDFYKAYFEVDTIPAEVTNEDTANFPWSITADEFVELTTATYNGETITWSQRKTTDNLAEMQASEDWLWFADMIGYEYNDGGIGTYMWTKFLNQLTYEELMQWVTNGGRRTSAIDAVGKAAADYVDSTVSLNSTNSFSWGYNSVSSRTWNKDLTKKRGIVVAEIGLLDGKEAYYAPAVDLHRSPFAGRNDEYWSEDGFFSGHMAGSMLAGVQSTGMPVTIKHFALNENENNRQSLHTYVSEQAFREIYLPAFQICMQEYQAQGNMSAYNCIGDMHASSAYNFLVGLSEKEWGFDGMSVTDAADPWKDFYTHDMALRSGSTMFLCDWSASKNYVPGYAKGGNTVQLYPTGEYNETENKVYVREDGTVADSPKTVESYTSWYWLRYQVMRSLFMESQTAIAKNGINLADFVGGDLGTVLQGAEIDKEVGLKGVNAEFVCDENVLPEGLEISDGKLTGTPTKAGTYTIAVTLNSGNIITKTANYTLKVESAFKMDDEGYTLKAGEEYLGYISSDTIVLKEDGNDSKYTEMTYAVAAGYNLPAGLTLNTASGEVSGTPTVDGKYTVVFEVTCKEESSSSGGNKGGKSVENGAIEVTPFGKKGGSSSKETVFTYEYTFEIAAGEGPVEKPITMEDLSAQIAKLEQQIATLEAEIAALEENSAEANTLKAQLETLNQELDALEAQVAGMNNEGFDILGGCMASISVGMIAPVLLAGAFVMAKKGKKEE